MVVTAGCKLKVSDEMNVSVFKCMFCTSSDKLCKKKKKKKKLCSSIKY